MFRVFSIGVFGCTVSKKVLTVELIFYRSSCFSRARAPANMELSYDEFSDRIPMDYDESPTAFAPEEPVQLFAPEKSEYEYSLH